MKVLSPCLEGQIAPPRGHAIRYCHPRSRSRRTDGRGPYGRAGSCRGPRQGGRRKDPHLGRRAVQFHQHARKPRQFHQPQPPFLQVGAETLYPVGFSGSGRTARNRMARKDPWPVVLRRVGETDRGDAAGRDESRRCRSLALNLCSGCRAGRSRLQRHARARGAAGRGPNRACHRGHGRQIHPENGRHGSGL